MQWHVASRADPRGAALADRHYSRKTVGHPQFTPPGRCLVLLTSPANALWVSSWPNPQYRAHRYMKEDVWLCTLFRNESSVLSSTLITEAVAATRWKWGQPPPEGMITFVDASKVRKKRDWGYCFHRAGFEQVGRTKGGLVVMQLCPIWMPDPCPAIHAQLPLFA